MKPRVNEENKSDAILSTEECQQLTHKLHGSELQEYKYLKKVLQKLKRKLIQPAEEPALEKRRLFI